MIEKIRKSFIEIIISKTWIDDQTKALCVQKAEKMSKKVLYPAAVLNGTAINLYYKPLDMRPGKYFENYMSLNRWRVKAEYESAIDPGAKLLNWDEGIYQTNAFYSPIFNEFSILAAIVDTPYYEIGVPKYLNYGSIGTVIGHEMTHGFDTQGMYYNPAGQHQTWWKLESIIQFENRAACFVYQYGNMSMYIPYRNRTLHVNGTKTLGENMADSGGVNSAFRAWKTSTSGTKAEPVLPGMPTSMSPEKLFFISLAQTYCVKSNFDTLENSFLTDEHTPDELRVNGFVMNSNDFSSAFKCTAGSPMNPVKKCKLW
ncbi:endothelin-converting enzyme homolog [Tubulanus polymorphus]|uniref:endothelin-converting enzyme homolog n=1 Tax=Tubulanus polymorphus TaxID=672921 RepID=UPI003DA60AF2